MFKFSYRTVKKSVPSSIICDVCGSEFLYNDEHFSFSCNELQGYGTIRYVADAGFAEKEFVKHFCSFDCFFHLLRFCQYDCKIYLPRPLIEQGVSISKKGD